MSLNLPVMFGDDWITRFPVLVPLPVWQAHFLFWDVTSGLRDVTSGLLNHLPYCPSTFLPSLVMIGPVISKL